MKLQDALKRIIMEFGISALKEKRLVFLLSDYKAFDDYPAVKPIMKSIVEDGYGNELCRLLLDGRREKFLDYAGWLKKTLSADKKFKPDLACYAVDSILSVMGLVSSVNEPSDHGYEPFAKSEEVVSEEEPNQCRKDGMRDSGEDTLDQICRLRRSFDELQGRHSDDSAFALSVRSALDAADFPSEEQLRKEFANCSESALWER